MFASTFLNRRTAETSNWVPARQASNRVMYAGARPPRIIPRGVPSSPSMQSSLPPDCNLMNPRKFFSMRADPEDHVSASRVAEESLCGSIGAVAFGPPLGIARRGFKRKRCDTLSMKRGQSLGNALQPFSLTAAGFNMYTAVVGASLDPFAASTVRTGFRSIETSLLMSRRVSLRYSTAEERPAFDHRKELNVSLLRMAIPTLAAAILCGEAAGRRARRIAPQKQTPITK